MRILLHDIIQRSNAPAELKSPALEEVFSVFGNIAIDLDTARRVDCIGIGNTDGTTFTVNGLTVDFTRNGLYVLPAGLYTSRLDISTNATYIGRLGAGLAVDIPTHVRKEPGWDTTIEPRTTLGGQVIPGRGGRFQGDKPGLPL